MPTFSRLGQAQPRSWLRRLMPSMFQRRLRLLALGVIAVCALLCVQMARLTVTDHADLQARAESVLTRVRLIPTSRGRILDRKQRVLAQDRPAYDICVAYEVITGKWSYKKARRDAFRDNKATWGELDPIDREALVARYTDHYSQQVERLWQDLASVSQVDLSEIEAQKARVIERVQQVASHIWLKRLEQRTEQGQDVELADVAQPISEQRADHPLILGASADTLAFARRMIDLGETDDRYAVWQQVSVMPSRQREYPSDTMTVEVDRSHFPGPLRSDKPAVVQVNGIASLIVGNMRDTWKEDFDQKPFRAAGKIDLKGYISGDRTGSTGIESAQEDRLRGTRGRITEDLETLKQYRLEPTPGRDVSLTIDAHLQARIQALMDPSLGLTKRQPWHQRNIPESEIGRPLNGAAVVLDIASSQILAAVSLPTMGREEIANNPKAYLDDHINQPYINRPVAMPYQPGSTVKPLVLSSAITQGKLGLHEEIECHGYLGFPDTSTSNRYRCWIYKQFNSTHGPLDGPHAIAASCNIFFYTLGRRLGARGLTQWFARFGLGSTLGCGLNEEVAGDLPDLARADDPNTPGFGVHDAINMGIGQGPIRWTPIQAACAYAALVRGGYLITPTFLMNNASQRSEDLRMDSRGVEAAIQGLDLCVNDPTGTANHIYTEVDGQRKRENTINIEGVKVYAKTGTADAVALRVDSDGDGVITTRDTVVRDGDHAWFVGLVQRAGSSRPDYVVVVVVEYAGSGGAVSGPIANQILYAMRSEGYL